MQNMWHDTSSGRKTLYLNLNYLEVIKLLKLMSHPMIWPTKMFQSFYPNKKLQSVCEVTFPSANCDQILSRVPILPPTKMQFEHCCIQCTKTGVLSEQEGLRKCNSSHLWTGRCWQKFYMHNYFINTWARVQLHHRVDHHHHMYCCALVYFCTVVHMCTRMYLLVYISGTSSSSPCVHLCTCVPGCTY